MDTIQFPSRMMKSFHWNFLLPIQTILVLLKLIFSPEIHAKKSKVWRIPSRDWGEPSVNNDVSSEYCNILYSSPFILMPLMSLLFRIKMSRISAHIINKYGEIFSLPTSSSRLELFWYYPILYNTWTNIFIKDFYPLLNCFTKVKKI